MINKPPDFIPDYIGNITRRTISVVSWQEIYDWVCRCEGSEVSIIMTYGRLEYDKNAELVVSVKQKEIKIKGILKDVYKDSFFFRIFDKESNCELEFGSMTKYDHHFCKVSIINNNKRNKSTVSPYNLSIESLEIGSGRWINHQGEEGWFGLMGI